MRRAAIIILVLFVFIRSSCGQQQGQGQDNCHIYGQHCVKPSDCPSAEQIIASRRAKFCGYEKTIGKMCCPKSHPSHNMTRMHTNSSIIPAIRKPTLLSPATPTTSPATPPHTAPKPPTHLSSTNSSANPSTAPYTRAPTRQRNSTAVALENCEKYAEYRHVKHYLPPDLPGENITEYYVTDCVNVVTLISEGNKTEPKEYPHMAVIGYGKLYKDVEWGCGGSLISEKFILSAAHCTKTALGDAKWVLLGDLHISSTSDDARPAVYSIVEHYHYPNYKVSSAYHDISLYKLNTSVVMSPYVRPACIYTSLFNKDNDLASITGWGTTGPIDQRSDHLLKATISFIPHERCRKSYQNRKNLHRGYDSNTQVCAGDLSTGKDTCPGDSGGPLQILTQNHSCMWAIVGVTSIGTESICGNTEDPDPGVYTRVAYYLDWIQSVVWP